MKKDGCTYWVCSVCGYKKTVFTLPRISSVKLEKTQYAYNGKTITPKVVVKDRSGNKLQKNIDYKVKYDSGRTELGKYSVLITFCGDYSGMKELSFKIQLGKVENIRIVRREDGGKAVLSWTKVFGAQEYEVQVYAGSMGYIALDNRIKQGKKLSIFAQNETIRIRACAEINGKMHYGPYSDNFVVTAE